MASRAWLVVVLFDGDGTLVTATPRTWSRGEPLARRSDVSLNRLGWLCVIATSARPNELDPILPDRCRGIAD